MNVGQGGNEDLPVDVAELVLALPRFQGDGYVECSAGGDGAANARHGDDGDVFDLDVGSWFGDEHEGFIEAEEETFVGFDGAFDTVHVVMAGNSDRISDWPYRKEDEINVVY